MELRGGLFELFILKPFLSIVAPAQQISWPMIDRAVPGWGLPKACQATTIGEGTGTRLYKSMTS